MKQDTGCKIHDTDDRMKRIIGVLAFVILLVVGQVAWADEPLRTVVQQGHNGIIKSIAFSPDGKILASGSGDNTIKLWTTSNGFLIRTLGGHSDWVYSIAFSPDGKILASGSGDKTVKLWNVSDGALIKTIEKHSRSVYSIAFSPDGKIFASGGGDNTIRLWKMPDGSLIRTLKGWLRGHSDWVYSIAFSPDGKILASGSGDKTVKLWNVSDGSLIRTSEGHLFDVKSVVFSPDGNILGSCGKHGTIKLWKTSDGSLVRTLKGSIPSIAFSPDGRFLASGDCIGIPQFWNLSDGSLISNIKEYVMKSGFGLNVLAESVAFSPDGKILASGGGTMSVSLWNVSDGSLIRTLKGDRDIVNSVAFAPDGRVLASANTAEVKLWKISDGSLLRTLWGHSESVHFIGFSADGKILASGSGDKTVKLWKVSDGSLIKTLEAHSLGVFSVAFSPDGRLLATASEDGKIAIWRRSVKDYRYWRRIRTLVEHRGAVLSVAFSPDGNILASAGIHNAIRLWKTTDWSLIKILGSQREESFYSVAFSPDGRIVASGGFDGSVKLWDISSGFLKTLIKGGSPIRTMNGYIGSVFSLAFSPDGRILASGSADNTVKLWKVSDGSLIKTLEGHSQEVRSVAFSPDKRLLISGSWDGTTKIWRQYGLCTTLVAVGRDSSLIITPEGFFSGSGDFNKYVHFVKGLTVYEFNQFYDAFYRPDLVEKKLKGEDISKYTGGLNIEDAIKNPPPKVTILSPKGGDSVSKRTATFKVRIKDTGGKIGDIRIHHNGKLVDSLGVYRLARTETGGRRVKLAKADIENPYQTTRGTTLRRVWGDADKKEIQETEFKPAEGTVEKTYKITLINGENTISVSAFNGTNTVMSAMESIKIKADIPKRKPELFAFVVGNNRFMDPTWDLSLAVKDAKDFSETFKKVASPLYKEVHIKTLTDANKVSVVEAITEMKAKMKPEDIFIFFAATHGWAYDDRYYLYTTDFDGDLWSKQSSISSIELMEFSKWLPALKQVFILDTLPCRGNAGCYIRSI